MKTYAIADTHGYYDLFAKALDRIEENAPGKVVFLGDYVDRGPQSRQIIERLMQGPPEGWEWVILQGNHEAMMLNAFDKPLNARHWLDNGGARTLFSYGAFNGMAISDALALVPMEHREFLEGLGAYHIDNHRIYVHGWVDRYQHPENSSRDALQWSLFKNGDDYPWTQKNKHRHIVHGHHAHPEGPLLYINRTNLDVGVYHTNKLAVGVFDGKGGPERIMEIT